VQSPDVAVEDASWQRWPARRTREIEIGAGGNLPRHIDGRGSRREEPPTDPVEAGVEAAPQGQCLDGSDGDALAVDPG
jgi:hypothetical protein